MNEKQIIRTGMMKLTAAEKVQKLRERGVKLDAKLRQKAVTGMNFLSKISLVSDKPGAEAQCEFLHLIMGVDYAKGLMQNFETETGYWLSNLEYNTPIMRWQECASIKEYECPDEGIKRMYDGLFRRLKPEFQRFGVEFDLAMGRRIVVPHGKKLGMDLTKSSSGFKMEFGGYVLNMKPCLSSLSKALKLLDILSKEEDLSNASGNASNKAASVSSRAKAR